MIDRVIDKITEVLQRDTDLKEACVWQKINGLVPGKTHTISVGCEAQEYAEYNRDYDECNGKFMIYVSLDNRCLSLEYRKDAENRLEYGERRLHDTAALVRYLLTENYSLDGLVDVGYVSKIDFTTADAQEDLHIAVIAFEAKFYAERRRPKGFTVETIRGDINEEVREITGRGE